MQDAPNSEGSKLLERFRGNVERLKLLSILVEVVLIGLSFAVAASWSTVVLSSSEYWLENWAEPLQKLIAALIITALAILAAVLSVLYLYTKPTRLILQKQLTAACDPRVVLPRSRAGFPPPPPPPPSAPSAPSASAPPPLPGAPPPSRAGRQLVRR